MSHPQFMQVRYLDKSGMERIRVDRNTLDHISLVDEKQLQDKSRRYYFSETRNISSLDLWYSNLDLNMEHEQLVLPIRPTFRIAQPVYHQGLFEGIVIVNVDAGLILNQVIRSTDFEVMLIDGEGELLAHPDPKQAWSRYFSQHKNLYDAHPDDAFELIHSTKKQVNGIFKVQLSQLFKNKQKLQILLSPKKETLDSLLRSNLFSALAIALVVLLISFPLSWLAALVPARLQQKLSSALSDLKRSQDIIDRHVMSSSTDPAGVITKVSHKMCESTGFNKDELIGHTHSLLRHPDVKSETFKELWQTITRGDTWQGELRNLTHYGKAYWIEVVMTPEYDAAGELTGYTEIAQDISPRKELEKISITDALTSCYNRRKLDLLLATELERFIRYQQIFAVILIDVDHFKQVNDTFGHQSGDEVLVQLAASMSTHIRKVDHLGRWGGEEFLVVCPGTQAKEAGLLAEKIRCLIESETFSITHPITISLGVAQCQQGEEINQLITRADEALYQAKHEGRNRTVIAP